MKPPLSRELPIWQSLSVLALWSVAATAGAVDRHKIDIDPESQDGILLQRIRQEPTQPRKLALLEKFAAEYPKATSIAWVYDQLLPIYKEAKDNEKVISTAERLLALDPADLDAADDALLAAQAKNDSEGIRKYAQLCWDIATHTLQSPKPKDPDDTADWTKQIEFARGILSFSEYVLANEAKQEQDPQKKADLIQALATRNPQSKFMPVAKDDHAHIDLASLPREEAVALAEKGLESDPDNEDFLITVANYYMDREQDLPKVLNYSLRLLDLLQRKPRPDSVSVEDWEAKKAKYSGWANWMAGVIYAKDARYGLSDHYLRSALGRLYEERLLTAAYFYLGYDNYAMAGELRDKSYALEALKFDKLCAASDGPFHDLALKNLEALRTEYNVQ